jgi:hypothetical protein
VGTARGRRTEALASSGKRGAQIAQRKRDLFKRRTRTRQLRFEKDAGASYALRGAFRIHGFGYERLRHDRLRMLLHAFSGAKAADRSHRGTDQSAGEARDQKPCAGIHSGRYAAESLLELLEEALLEEALLEEAPFDEGLLEESPPEDVGRESVT